MRPDNADYVGAQIEGTPDTESLKNHQLLTAALTQYGEQKKQASNLEETGQGLMDFGRTMLNIPLVIPDMAITFAHKLGKGMAQGQDAVQAGVSAIWDALDAGEARLLDDWSSNRDTPAMKFMKDIFKPGPGEDPGLALEAGALGLELLAGAGVGAPESVGRWMGRHAVGAKGMLAALKRIAMRETKTGLEQYTDDALKNLAEISQGKYSDLIRRAHAGDEIATRRVNKLMGDPQVAEMIGQAELTAIEEDIVKKGQSARWYRYGSKDIPKEALIAEAATQAKRASGDVDLVLKELNGEFASTPFSMRHDVLNTNNAQDVEDLMKEYGAQAEQYIAKAFKNAADNPENQKAMNELLTAQKFSLQVNVGDAINLPMNNAQAFGVNMLLNQIHQNIKASIRMGHEYAFSSGPDMLRFFKLLAMRQQVIANVTGRSEGLTKLLAVLHTGYDVSGDAIRYLRIKRAMKRLPRIAPVVAKRDAGAVLEDQAWKWTAGEFAKLKQLSPELEKMGAGVANELGPVLKAAQQALEGVDRTGLSVLKQYASRSARMAEDPVSIIDNSDLPDVLKRLLGSTSPLPLTIRSALAQKMTEQVGRKLVAGKVPQTAPWFNDVIAGKYGRKTRRMVLKAIAGDIEKLDTTEQLSSYLNGITRGALGSGNWVDKLYTHFIVSILSNPATHAANIITNAAVSTIAPAADVAAAAFRFVQGDYDKGAQNLGMATARIYSWLETMGDLSRIGAKYGLEKLPENYQKLALTRKAKRWASAKLKTMDKGLSDYAGGYEIPASSLAFGKETIHNLSGPQKAAYHMTRLLHMPTTAMGHADAVFKAIASNSEQRARNWYRAWNMASDSSSARQIYTRMGALKTDLDRARNYLLGEEATFQEELTERFEKYVNAVRTFPGMRWILPFVKTPLNMKRYMTRATGGMNLVPVILNELIPEGSRPLWIRNSKLVQKLSAGGTHAEAALGQLALGNGVLGGLMLMGTYGKITGSGGVSMPNERLVPYPKYTIFWDDKAYYYGNNEIMKWIIGYPITLKEIFHQVDWESEDMVENALALARHVGAATGEMLLDGSFLNTYVDFMDGVKHALEGNNWFYIKRTAFRIASGTLVPYSGALAFATRQMQPIMRDVEGLMGEFVNRYGMGHAGKNNPYSIDLFGNPRMHDLSGSVYPINLTGPDPVIFELRQLRPSLKDVPVSMSPMFRVGAQEGRKYNAWERKTMRLMIADGKFFGVRFYDAVKATMESQLYKSSDMAHRRILLEHLNNQYIQAAEQQLLMQERIEPGVLGEERQ